MSNYGLARKMIAITAQTFELRQDNLKPAKPDFGQKNHTLIEKDWQACGHAAPVLESFCEYPKAIRVHGNEVPEQLLIVAQVELIRRNLGHPTRDGWFTPELRSKEVLKELAEAVEGWDDIDALEIWVNEQAVDIEETTAISKVALSEDRRKAREKSYRKIVCA